MVFIRIHGICCCPHDVDATALATSPGETMKRERVVLREGAVGLQSMPLQKRLASVRQR
jgi:hypothetical protein